jgi:hypothetical protein
MLLYGAPPFIVIFRYCLSFSKKPRERNTKSRLGF